MSRDLDYLNKSRSEKAGRKASETVLFNVFQYNPKEVRWHDMQVAKHELATTGRDSVEEAASKSNS